MLAQLRRRAKKLDIEVDTRIMDGSKLEFEDDRFDAVILHLIVAVIPDPVGCLRETERVLKTGGKITIMDKFVPSGQQPGVLRRVLSFFSNIIATHLNRDIDALLNQTNFTKTNHQKLGSIFWLINAQKVG
jgi:ubiquinone/menaquinone biosynthesis C-methylase UbiE